MYLGFIKGDKMSRLFIETVISLPTNSCVNIIKALFFPLYGAILLDYFYFIYVIQDGAWKNPYFQYDHMKRGEALKEWV